MTHDVLTRTANAFTPPTAAPPTSKQPITTGPMTESGTTSKKSTKKPDETKAEGGAVGFKIGWANNMVVVVACFCANIYYHE